MLRCRRWIARATALTMLAAVAAAATAPGQVVAQAPANAVDLELVLAVDVSGSIDEEEARLQRDGLVAAFRNEAVVGAIQAGSLKRIAVTLLEWAGSGRQWTLVDWHLIDDMASAGAFADKLEAEPLTTAMFTSISNVMDFAARRLAASPFEAPRQVVDISGDGPNNHGELVVPARDRLLARDVVINGLPIINGRPSRYGMPAMPNLDLYYEDCVIGGPGSFLVVANGFKDFARAIRRKLILEIAGAVPPAPRLWRAAHSEQAQSRHRPPCNAGEERLRLMREDF